MTGTHTIQVWSHDNFLGHLSQSSPRTISCGYKHRHQIPPPHSSVKQSRDNQSNIHQSSDLQTKIHLHSIHKFCIHNLSLNSAPTNQAFINPASTSPVFRNPTSTSSASTNPAFTHPASTSQTTSRNMTARLLQCTVLLLLACVQAAPVNNPPLYFSYSIFLSMHK